jgi:AcrR family transcriptional regulator
MSARDDIRRAAEPLFLSQGFPATTVDGICENAEVSKGSFYYHFETKEELGLASLEEFFEKTQALLAKGKFWKLEDPIKRIFGFIEHVEAISKDLWGKGCLFASFAVDLAESSPEIQGKVSELLHTAESRLAPLFRPRKDVHDDGGGGPRSREGSPGMEPGEPGPPEVPQLPRALELVGGSVFFALGYTD